MTSANATASESLLMTVSLRLPPADEAGFNAFYHHRYIPKLWQQCSVFDAVWRYEEFGTAGSLRWFNKEFLTIYRVKSGCSEQDVEAALAAPGREAEVAEWKQWKERALKECRREFFHEIYRHPREPWGGPFASRPFFRVSVMTKEEQTAEFETWYHQVYLPKIMADVPTWSACRRYRSTEPGRLLAHTIYETDHALALEESFGHMRSPHRYESNADWEAWAGRAICEQDATSFRPIFRYPG